MRRKRILGAFADYYFVGEMELEAVLRYFGAERITISITGTEHVMFKSRPGHIA